MTDGCQRKTHEDNVNTQPSVVCVQRVADCEVTGSNTVLPLVVANYKALEGMDANVQGDNEQIKLIDARF